VATREVGREVRNEPRVTASDVLRVLRRGLIFALVLGALSGAAAYYISSTSTPIYAARVGVVVSQPGEQYRGMNVVTPTPVDAVVYQRAILNGDVAPAALTRLEGAPPSASRLRRFLGSVQVSVENSRVSSTIWVEVRDASPQFAAAAANALASELIEWDRERGRRALDRSIEALERSVASLRSELEEGGADGNGEAISSLLDQRASALESARRTAAEALFVSLIEPLRTVDPPSSPVSPTVPFDTFVGILLGVIAGYGVHVLYARLNPPIEGASDVASETGRPILAEFPARSRRSAHLRAEAAGFLHNNVAFATRGEDPRAIVVTSPVVSSERAGVAMSLAERFARSGQRTVLVDADLREASVTSWLGGVPPQAATFDAYLAHPERDPEPLSIALGGRWTYDLIPGAATEAFPPDLLNSGLEAFLSRLRERYDVVVFDGAPVVPVSDTLAIALHCTGTVICVRAGRTKRDQVRAATSLLDRTGVDVLGFVVTHAATMPSGQPGRRAVRAATSTSTGTRRESGAAGGSVGKGPRRPT
jgi:Mrp family chromosome partitioning ATPase